ncbi:MAG: glycosyltransferase [Bacillota bacterium]|nr:MAG: glycosyltransferase [Bacillota bacterium]
MNIIIIPAYEPTLSLISLIKDLKAYPIGPIIVIDDGSGSLYREIFETAGNLDCIVVTHETNLGKGAAIKSGIQEAQKRFKDINAYITCDSDGQHLPQDIFNIYEKSIEYPNHFILGVRKHRQKGIPLKSKLGNIFSSFYFRLSTGVSCPDTQTGLRAIPVLLTEDALGIKENRYDYEMVFLTKQAKSGFPMYYVDIDTIYIENNRASHFKPIKDSILIYKQPIRFTLASISSAVIDIGIFTLLILILKGTLLESVAIASITARLISGYYNFLMNRLWSFNNRENIKSQLIKYGILYVIQLLSSIFLVTFLAHIFSFITYVKLVVDGTLFVISYFIQKHWVFRKKSTN